MGDSLCAGLLARLASRSEAVLDKLVKLASRTRLVLAARYLRHSLPAVRIDHAGRFAAALVEPTSSAFELLTFRVWALAKVGGLLVTCTY